MPEAILWNMRKDVPEITWYKAGNKNKGNTQNYMALKYLLLLNKNNN